MNITSTTSKPIVLEQKIRLLPPRLPCHWPDSQGREHYPSLPIFRVLATRDHHSFPHSSPFTFQGRAQLLVTPPFLLFHDFAVLFALSVFFSTIEYVVARVDAPGVCAQPFDVVGGEEVIQKGRGRHRGVPASSGTVVEPGSRRWCFSCFYSLIIWWGTAPEYDSSSARAKVTRR